MSPRTLRDPQTVKKRKRYFYVKTVLAGVLFTAFIMGMSWVSQRPSMLISRIDVMGNRTLRTHDLKEIVEKEISEKYIGLFPKNNIFLYPKTHIKKVLKETHQEISFIEIKAQDPTTLLVSVEERRPLYLWCGEEREDNTKVPKCYYVDRDGYVFRNAPYFSGQVLTAFYGKLVDASVSGGTDVASVEATQKKDKNIGKFVLSSPDFNLVVSFMKNLQDFQLPPESVFVDEQRDAVVFLSSGGQLIFSLDTELEELVSNVRTVLSSEVFSKQKSSKYTSFQYIDLRFGNKVFYRTLE